MTRMIDDGKTVLTPRGEKLKKIGGIAIAVSALLAYSYGIHKLSSSIAEKIVPLSEDEI